jgi:hypothetical protein
MTTVFQQRPFSAAPNVHRIFNITANIAQTLRFAVYRRVPVNLQLPQLQESRLTNQNPK